MAPTLPISASGSGWDEENAAGTHKPGATAPTGTPYLPRLAVYSYSTVPPSSAHKENLPRGPKRTPKNLAFSSPRTRAQWGTSQPRNPGPSDSEGGRPRPGDPASRHALMTCDARGAGGAGGLVPGTYPQLRLFVNSTGGYAGYARVGESLGTPDRRRCRPCLDGDAPYGVLGPRYQDMPPANGDAEARRMQEWWVPTRGLRLQTRRL